MKLSPLEDQQRGGLIMWVRAGLLFTTCAMVAFGLWLHRFEALPHTCRAAASAALEDEREAWKTVDNVTSGAFVGMWRQRVSHFYSRYSDAAAN